MEAAGHEPPRPPPTSSRASSVLGTSALAGGATADGEPGRTTDAVIAARSGDVLLKHTLLKSDHFPGCQNKKLTPLLEGAPNFRQIPGLPVYGVAIPTAAGLRRVLDALGAARGRRRVVWVNLREEPVTYINGAPFVVREAARPFANLEYTGIDATRLEDMEARLRADVLREAARWGGQVLVAHEGAGFQVVDAWEGASEADVQTPAAVYAELGDDGYDVQYVRLPITDEKAPKDADFGALLCRLWRPPAGAAIVFNCQMGRGRTTTGMVIAALVALRRAVGCAGAPWALPPAPLPGLPPWFAAAAAAAAADAGAPPGAPASGPGAAPDADLRAGRFAVVRSLLRALARGKPAKAALDAVVDAAEAMQNLREAVAGYRARLAAEPDDDKRSALLAVALEYLERYCVLIAFSAYLGSARADPEGEAHEPFGAWMRARPELRSVLARMLRSNPLAALALHHHPPSGGGGGGGGGGAGAPPPPPPPPPPLASPPRRPPGAVSLRSPLRTGSDGDATDADGDASETDADEAAALDAAAALVARRAGGVLGPCTILKEDHFPGCQAPGLARAVEGAPNFRGVPGRARVYGSGAPTAAGVAGVLAAVLGGGGGRAPAAGPPAPPPPPAPAVPSSAPAAPSSASVLWVNLREEVCLYINGTPFVLREAGRPFKNMREYDGISARRLEAMEARLKADVLAEAEANGGRVLVAREVVGGGGGAPASPPAAATRPPGDAAPGASSTVIDTWEPVADARAVQTPREVYEAAAAGAGLGAGGLAYVRVPLTDGAAPRPAAFDALVDAVGASPPSAPVVVSCQMGGGRTTTGMAVACLVRASAGGGGGGGDGDGRAAGPAGARPPPLAVAGLSPLGPGGGGPATPPPWSPEGPSPVGAGGGGWPALGATAAAGPADTLHSHHHHHHDHDHTYSRIDGLSPRYCDGGLSAGGTTTAGSEPDRPTSPPPPPPPPHLPPISTARPGPASAPSSAPGSARAGGAPSSAPWWQQHPPRYAPGVGPPPSLPESASAASLVGAGDGGLDSEAASVWGGPSGHGGGAALAELAASAANHTGQAIDPREAAALRDGDYEGVRRFTRVLACGEAAKSDADAAVDAAGGVVNLRTAIARYRRPRRTFRFYRPEIHARHAAFTRGLACLERYCWLIALAAYLRERAEGGRGRGPSGSGEVPQPDDDAIAADAAHQQPPSPPPTGATSFSAWVGARPDLRGAAEAIRANPAGALAPVRAPVVPSAALAATPSAEPGRLTPPPTSAAPASVSDAELRRVLAARQGGTLTRRSILKSYCLPPAPPPAAAAVATFDGVALAGLHPGAPDVRTIGGGCPPVVTVGSATLPGLAALLTALDCGPGGRRAAVITDLREELAVYVRGVPYLRRELDQPAAALHHAGAPASSLESLERRLVGDLVAEAAAWDGRVLLHRGDAAAPTAGGGGGAEQSPSPSAAGGRPPRPPLSRSGSGVAGMLRTAGSAGAAWGPGGGPGGGGGGGGGPTSPGRPPATSPPPPPAPQPPAVAIEDVTVELDARPAEAVTPFWEVAGPPGDAAGGVATPRAVAGALRAAGFALRYARVPLSRERTPDAADLDALGRQMDVAVEGRTPVHIFLSRTATGSSARFAAVLATGVLALRAAASAAAAGGLSQPMPAVPAGLAARLLAAGGDGSAASSVADLTALDGGGGGRGTAGGPPAAASAAWAVPGRSPLASADATGLFGTSPGAGAMLRAGGWSGLESLAARAGGGGGPPSAALAGLGLGGISEEEGGDDGWRAPARRPGARPLSPPPAPPPPPLPPSPSPLADNRSLMNLCRVLPRGRIAQAAVDAAAEAASPAVGDLRADVGRCEAAAASAAAAADAEPADAADPAGSEARRARAAAASAAARRLGLHYLQRYFYLVAFFSYLAAAEGGQGATQASSATGGRQSFATWFADRRELRHLLSTLSFERGDGRG